MIWILICSSFSLIATSWGLKMLFVCVIQIWNFIFISTRAFCSSGGVNKPEFQWIFLWIFCDLIILPYFEFLRETFHESAVVAVKEEANWSNYSLYKLIKVWVIVLEQQAREEKKLNFQFFQLLSIRNLILTQFKWSWEYSKMNREENLNKNFLYNLLARSYSAERQQWAFHFWAFKKLKVFGLSQFFR